MVLSCTSLDRHRERQFNDNDIEVLGKIHAKIIEDCIFILIAFLLQTVEMQCKKMYNKVN